MNKNQEVNAFNRLIQALQILPNVGAKTAQRMAHTLLQHNRQGAAELMQAIDFALKQVNNCRLCNTFCEDELCYICSDKTRDFSRLMIVQMPAEVANMEKARCHDGVYFVLMGQVNPTQGMDLSQVALEKLIKRLDLDDSNQEIKEVIIATSHTAEGEATAYVLYELLKNQEFKISRLARGISLGSELEYVDAGTLAQAVYERSLLK